MMSDIVSDSMALERVGSLMTMLFALAALLMATLGVYGLVAYSVRQRTVEIGTRMALGASNRDVLSLVVGAGLRMTAFGLVVGAVGVAGAVAVLARLLDLHDIGWVAWVSSTATITLVTTVASSLPAWRATRLSPMVAIRDESHSIWESAQSGIRKVLRGVAQVLAGAEEPIPVSESELLGEFVAAARRAESPKDQMRMAMATLRDRLGAQSALLFERAAADLYRCTTGAPHFPSDGCSLPAHGFLVH
ncbi:MAG TPA: FtsX-like permease family protein, partial [Vicinamibacterales bacterium]|nr:FtsX-like permease family protein [Vicinamibacterales bacterium]